MKNAKRISELKSCSTVDALMEDMFPSSMDGMFTSFPDKRRLVAEWITAYKDGTQKPSDLKLSSILRPSIPWSDACKYDTPAQLSEGIYPLAWDDNTMLFQELRAALVEWVERFATKHNQMAK